MTHKAVSGFASFCSRLLLLMAAASLLPTICHAGDKSSLRLYNVGGLNSFNKPVVSFRKNRFKNLVEQKYDFSCGAAATTTVLRYAYNLNVSELDVIKGMAQVADPEIVKEKGFSLLDIRKYVETHGLRGRGYKISEQALEQIKIPTIVLLDIKGYKHFVVLRRVIDDTVFVGDPALGNRTMSKGDFIASWNGSIFAVVGRGFNRDNVLSRPEKPLTARRFLFDKQAPVTNADLLDFGFSHADLF